MERCGVPKVMATTGRLTDDTENFQIRAERAERALDAVHEPILVVSPDSHLIHANRSGEELLHGSRGLRRRRHVLVCESVGDTRNLHRAVARFALAPDVAEPASVIAVSRAASVRPLAVVVCALASPARTAQPSIGRAQSEVLIKVHDPDRIDQADPMRLREQFGLTAAEARLAAALVARQSVHEYALHRGLKLSTVRSALKSILAKTGCRRQSELVLILKGWATFFALMSG